MTNARLHDFRLMALSAMFVASVAAAGAQTPSQVTDTAPVAGPALLMATTSEAVVAVAPATATTTNEPETSGVSSSLAEAAVPSDLATMGPGAAMGSSEAALPDAPSATELHAASPAFDAEFQPTGTATPNVAPKYTKYIPAGMVGQKLTAHDKFIVGVRDLYSPLNFVAMLASAGYEQALNGEPNYGTDRGAFGERLGAAAIRESTQGFFTDSVFSPMFHEDPRYYVRGYGHSFINRTVYSVTRVFVTRNDNGDSTVNGALLVGYAASSGLSYAYYPKINQNWHDTASTFGGSLGGAALGYFVSEFYDDALKMVHLKK